MSAEMKLAREHLKRAAQRVATELANRDAFEEAHPAARRRREAFEQMARRVHDFLDIPAYLPVRQLTPAEREAAKRYRLNANLAEHVRWVSLIPGFQRQAPFMDLRYVDV